MVHVEIVVKGQIDPAWSEWLNGFTIAHIDPDDSRLCGTLADQAALYGLLTKLRDLGLALRQVYSSEAGGDDAPQTETEE